jgi:hypothetical protein
MQQISGDNGVCGRSTGEMAVCEPGGQAETNLSTPIHSCENGAVGGRLGAKLHKLAKELGAEQEPNTRSRSEPCEGGYEIRRSGAHSVSLCRESCGFTDERIFLVVRRHTVGRCGSATY